MGLGSTIAKIFGTNLADPIEAIGNVFDKLFTSDEERKAAEAVLEKIKQRPAVLQAEINKLEAQHRSVWVAGWRPAIGWVCAASLAAYYIPQYVLASILWIKICWTTQQLTSYPASVDGLLELVTALLGMAVIRQVDKLSGRSK